MIHHKKVIVTIKLDLLFSLLSIRKSCRAFGSNYLIRLTVFVHHFLFLILIFDNYSIADSIV